MNKILLTLAAVFLTACAETLDSNSNTDSNIVIGVTADESVTRTSYTTPTDNSVVTTFESGDVIGLYAVDWNNDVIAENVRCTYDGTSWVFDSAISYCAGYRYYAYAPYTATPYTPDFTQIDIDDIFADFLTDASNRFHRADQSSKAAFQASDLMVARGVTGAGGLVTFRMKHKKGLVILEGNGVEDMTFTENVPYVIGDKGYFLARSGEITLGGENITVENGKKNKKNIINQDKCYLTFTALEPGTFTLTIPAEVTNTYVTSVSYSVDDGETWVTTANTSSDVTITTPTVPAGGRVLWKGIATKYAISYSAYSSFSSSADYDVSGNIMSLLHGDKFKGQKSLSGKNYSFLRLFHESKIVNAQDLKLPATTLATCCYSYLFQGCSLLTTTPELPAMTLAERCYESMFYSCTALTEAPELPATTLATKCYIAMFHNCKALTKAPSILPAMTLAERCYENMFDMCTSLTTAPELPATTLAPYCYAYMFAFSTNLNYVKAAFTTEPSATYTIGWLSSVAASGTFVKNSAATWDVTGVSGIPSGWTVETYTP